MDASQISGIPYPGPETIPLPASGGSGNGDDDWLDCEDDNEDTENIATDDATNVQTDHGKDAGKLTFICSTVAFVC